MKSPDADSCVESVMVRRQCNEPNFLSWLFIRKPASANCSRVKSGMWKNRVPLLVDVSAVIWTSPVLVRIWPASIMDTCCLPCIAPIKSIDASLLKVFLSSTISTWYSFMIEFLRPEFSIIRRNSRYMPLKSACGIFWIGVKKYREGPPAMICSFEARVSWLVSEPWSRKISVCLFLKLWSLPNQMLRVPI